MQLARHAQALANLRRLFVDRPRRWILFFARLPDLHGK